MLNFIFAILMFVVFGKLLMIAIKAAWSLTKILVTIVFLPFALIIIALAGLTYIAVGILVIAGGIIFWGKLI